MDMNERQIALSESWCCVVSPISETVNGEAQEIFPCLGSLRSCPVRPATLGLEKLHFSNAKNRGFEKSMFMRVRSAGFPEGFLTSAETNHSWIARRRSC